MMTEPDVTLDNGEISRGKLIRGSIIALAVVAVVLIALVLSGVFSADSELLEPSGPEEIVFRTLRLAGFEHAVLDPSVERTVLRLEMPQVTSAADFEIAWQTGAAALISAYPDADNLMIQLFEDSIPLLELRLDPAMTLEAVNSDDAALLREEARFAYLWDTAKGSGGTVSDPLTVVPEELASSAQSLLEASPPGAPLSDETIAIDIYVAGSYLDSKNRAAGLLDENGPTFGSSEDLATAVQNMRDSTVGIPAVPSDMDAATVWAERLTDTFRDKRVKGMNQVLEEVIALLPEASPEDVTLIRVRTLAATAVAAAEPYGSVLADVLSSAEDVAGSDIGSGPEADAVLASADDPDAPEDAVLVTAFERESSLDGGGSGVDPDLPGQTLASNGNDGSLSYLSSDGPVSITSDSWPAYRRADGTLYWLAGDDGAEALTDGSLRGWAFSVERSALVDAARCGIWLALFPLG